MYEIKNNLGPSNVLCYIGKSESGKILEPYYCESYKETIEEFKSGELVDLYKTAYNIGVNDIYLIRVNYNTDREKYQKFKQAYEVLESVEPDVVCPLGVKTDECTKSYKELMIQEEGFIINEATDTINLKKSIYKIDKFKINGIFLYNYIIEGEKIKLPKSIKKGSYIEVVYYAYKEIPFELEVVLFQDKKYRDSKSIKVKYNPYEEDKEIGKKLKDYFDLRNETYIDKYNIGEENEFNNFFYKTKNVEITNVIKPIGNKGYLLSPKYSSNFFKDAKIKGIKLDIKSNIKTFNDYIRPFEIPAYDIYFYINDNEKKIPINQLGKMFEFGRKIESFSFGIEINTEKLIIEELNISFIIESYPKNLKYFINHNYNYVNFFADIDGDSKITVKLDEEKFWIETQEKKYYYDFIIDFSNNINMLSIVEGLTELSNEYALNFQNIIKEQKDNSYFLISCLSECFYTESSINRNSAGLIAANIASKPINEYLTNNALGGIGSFDNQGLDIDLLSENGYCLITNTVRNGTVLRKATTLAKKGNPFLSIKNMRIALEFRKRWDRMIDNNFIGGPSILKENKNIIENSCELLLESLIDENKINNYQFDFKDNLFKISLNNNDELDLVKFSLLSDSIF